MQLSAPRGAPVIHRTAWEWNRGVGRTKSPVWLWNSVFLVFVWRIKNICCLFSFSRGVYGALVVLTFLKRSPAKEVGEAGEKTPIFPVGKVAIWIAKQSAARQIYGCFEMVSSPRKQVHYRKNNEV